MLNTVQEIVNLLYVARGQKKEILAGFGMGNFFMNAVFYAAGFGLNGALDTFVPQAYGRGQMKLCSIYLWRSRIILTIYFLFCLIIFMNARQVLVFFR